jgi:hypothetical protein
MEQPDLETKFESPLTRALHEFTGLAREQVEAAWDLQIARIQEQLASGWREEIDRIVAERFTELSARIAEETEAAVRTRVAAETAVAVPAACETSRRQWNQELNLAARRIAQAPGVEEWAAALLEATDAFREQAAVFTLTGRELKTSGVRGVPDQDAAARLLAAQMALSDAPAFEQAVETRETVFAMRSESELSPAIVSALGGGEDARAQLVPLCGRQRVLGVLYADGDAEHIDTNAIELLAAIGAAVLDALLARSLSRPGVLLSLSGVASSSAPAIAVWDTLSKQDQELHLRAQRFARVQVAEMRLYKSRQVRSGRVDRNLYGALKEEIETSREAFRRQFLAASPSMADYLHQELVRSLSNDDPSLLGPDYPGPLA